MQQCNINKQNDLTVRFTIDMGCIMCKTMYRDLAKTASTIYDFYSYFSFNSPSDIACYLTEKEKDLLDYLVNFKFNQTNLV